MCADPHSKSQLVTFGELKKSSGQGTSPMKMLLIDTQLLQHTQCSMHSTITLKSLLPFCEINTISILILLVRDLEGHRFPMFHGQWLSSGKSGFTVLINSLHGPSAGDGSRHSRSQRSAFFFTPFKKHYTTQTQSLIPL